MSVLPSFGQTLTSSCCFGGSDFRGWICDRWNSITGVVEISIFPGGTEGEKTWPVATGVSVNPGLVPGHSGVDSWEQGFTTFTSIAGDPCKDPPAALLAHEWTAQVALCGRRSVRKG